MPSRFARSMSHALRGLLTVWREERNFRLQIAATAVAVGVAWTFSFSYTEWLAVGVCVFLVLGAEILNTVVEDLLDKLHPGHDPWVGKIKDMAAGLVLLQSVGAVVIGGATLLHHFA